ncbi:MAG: HAMP domain-containing protein [Candidatus Fermentibacteraceae bacterium]|nr:HAMP domain-containing protein [Candidatus Fermentibacteraceae bacterium]MBN2607694.1 HAMP domain-containing protein [Candidatus Fermentibacteraceae bacterium]
MKTIFQRSFSGFLVAIAILAVLAPLLIYDTMRSRLNDLAVSNLTRTAESLEYLMARRLDEEPARLDSLVDGMGERLDFRVTVISRDGTVLADSEEDPDSMENHRTRPEVICAFNGLTGVSSRESATLGREMLYVAVPVMVGDSIPAVIRTSLFFSEQRSMLHDIFVDIAIVMVVMLIAGLAVALLISRSVSVPVRNIAGAARKVAEGDYSVRVPTGSIRDLNRLAADMNGMIARTDELIGELSDKNASLDAILKSIAGGLVVVDAEGRVVTANGSFRLMSGAGDSEEGASYLDFIADREFADFTGRVLREGVISGEISAGGRVYSARAAEVPGTGQFVVTFRDVTDLVETARMKRDFAANASHELRTPLTSIKGYAETLLEGFSGEDSRYLKTILRNTDRLIRIVDDMRTLAELEHPMTSMDISEVDLPRVVRDTADLFRSRAAKKGLELVVHSEDDVPVIMADRFRIEQVLINLVENAIRYTGSGSVTVMTGHRGDFVTIVVSDTGPGMEEKHLSRIFERFYVVDRARSRSRGGTGLGLAIVKHIVTLHGGWVRVSSSPGSGSMFTVGLPTGISPMPSSS